MNIFEFFKIKKKIKIKHKTKFQDQKFLDKGLNNVKKISSSLPSKLKKPYAFNFFNIIIKLFRKFKIAMNKMFLRFNLDIHAKFHKDRTNNKKNQNVYGPLN